MWMGFVFDSILYYIISILCFDESYNPSYCSFAAGVLPC